MTEPTPARPHPALFTTLALLTTMPAVVSAVGAPLVPDIAGDFGVSLTAAQWTLTVTLLAGAVSTPVIGRLAAGRRRTGFVLGGLAAVTLGGLLCTLPLAYPWFLAGRTLQGLGYGLTPVAIAIAREAIPAEKRSNAIAILSVTTVAGAGLGYPVAAMLAQAWGIRVAFGATVALALVTLVLAAVALPPSRRDRTMPVDWLGTLLLSAGTAAALLALAELTRAPGWVLAILGLVAVGAWAAWVPWARRARHPIVDVRLAARPVPLLAHATSALIGVGVYLALPLTAIVVQADGWGLGLGVSAAGWLLVPYSLVSVAGSRVGRRLGSVVNPLMLLPIGSATYLLAFVSMTLLHANVWQLGVAMMLAGLGSGLALAAIPGLLVRAVPPAETGSAVAFNMLVRYLGFSLGSTLAAFLLTVGGEPDEAAFVRALLGSCAIGVLTVVVSTWLAVRARRLVW